MNNIYLDYASSTPLKKEILESYYTFLDENYANSDSLHELGSKCAKHLKMARMQIASLLGVKEQEIIFTAGSTESNNMAIKGVAFAYQSRGKHIITTKVEHPSVLDSCKQLEKIFGFEVTYLDIDRQGKIKIDDLLKSIRKDTILISIQAVNSETGVIQDISKIAKIVKDKSSALFHVDATQAICKEEMDFSNVDLYNFSSHKFYGLKGSAVLIKKEKVRLVPLIVGGQQENGYRAGTVNYANAMMLSKALRLGMENAKKNYKYVKELMAYLKNGLLDIEGLSINSPKNSSPYILNIYLKDKKGEVLMNALSNAGIYVSTRSACSSKNKSYSIPVYEITHNETISKNCLRISISELTSKHEIDLLIKELKCISEKIKG